MATSKKTTKKKSTKAARVSGAVPPYGDPIRNAIARGNMAEMRKVAASTRKYLGEVEKALAQLEKAIGKK
jgi:hypothetical protein